MAQVPLKIHTFLLFVYKAVSKLNLATEGALGVFTKESGAEKITIRFNTNGTLPKVEEQYELEDAGKEVRCYPDFEVIIEKNGQKCMFFNCTVEDVDAEGEGDADPFEIHSISVSLIFYL